MWYPRGKSSRSLSSHHGNVAAPDAVLVVAHAAAETRDVAAHVGARRVGDPAAEVPARGADPVGKERRFRVHQEPDRFEGAGREHHHARVGPPVLAGRLVDVGHPRRAARRVHADLAHHGVGHQGQLPAADRRVDEDVRAREVGVGRAAAIALAAVVARRPAVRRLRDDGEAGGDAGDVQRLCGLHDEELVCAGARGRLEDPVRLIRKPLDAAEQADEAVQGVVVRLDLLVRDRPVGRQAVELAPPEVVRTEAERDPPPVVRAPPDHPRPPPAEAVALGHRVRLPLQRPSADARVELAEVAGGDPAPPPLRLVRPREHVRVGAVVPRTSRLEHETPGAAPGQDVGRRAASGARPYDEHVVVLLHPLHPVPVS